jgi:23S rRNA pseudouridine1911/1915/1917 synthase
MEPTVLFEDEDILVIDKPTGMIVYPDGKHDYPAVSGWLETKLQGPSGEKFFFVHRIDRETSGLLVIAKTGVAFEFIKEQFQERDIKKTYRAFVYGSLKEERGIIDKPIGSSRGGRGPRSATRPLGTQREAQTVWKLLGNSPGTVGESGLSVAYIEAFPKTGRTHQIRVHMAALQHPIICDQLYAPGRPPLLGFKRLALHAYTLQLLHPNGKEMAFEAPLPPDFVEAAQKLTGK